MKQYLLLLLFLLASACSKEVLFDTDTRIGLWLFHEGAEMPIVVEGNTNSKVFICLIHGGPGGTAQVFNSFFTPFSNPLEEDYAMVYWDQRNSGLSRGEWDISKITIDQHIDDVDQMIELIKFKFGDDSSIFLVGHSWGAYLGQAYLLDPLHQSKVKAWINIDGLSNRNQDMKDVLQKIQEVANEQIAQSSQVEIKYLIPEMYEFDNQFDQQLSNINLPSLFLYGQYDVRTPKSQAEYVMNNISTDQTDQRLVILPSSGHSSVGNEPVKLVTEIKQWIELYK